MIRTCSQGILGPHRCFVKGYGDIMVPLTRLLRKEGFRWNTEVEVAFHVLQLALTSALVLQLSNFTMDFVVECDVSDTGVGEVLHQGDGSIAFFSHQLTPCHAKLATYEHVLIGLVQVVRHWRPYL
jgi:hypothetical protein